jgi:hypothetical protein
MTLADQYDQKRAELDSIKAQKDGAMLAWHSAHDRAQVACRKATKFPTAENIKAYQEEINEFVAPKAKEVDRLYALFYQLRDELEILEQQLTTGL